MKELMMLYGVTLGRRFSRRDKNMFQQEIVERYSAAGYNVALDQGNMVAGDLKTAELVIAAAYDTPARAMLPGFRYFPLHKDQNLREQRRDLLLRLFVLVAFCVGAMVFYTLWRQRTYHLRMPALVLCILFLSLGAWLFHPRANKVNFSRNSASLAVMGKVLETMNPELRDRVAFVFMDRQAGSFDGIKVLYSRLGSRPHPTVLVLDAIAAGDTLVVAHQSAADAGPLLDALAGCSPHDKAYTSDTMDQNVTGFSARLLYLVSGTAEKGELVVKKSGTSHDHQLDLPRLEQIAAAISELTAVLCPAQQG